MPASPTTQSRSDRWTLVLCVAALTVLRIVCHPESAICLVAPPHQSLLSHEVAWNVPLTALPAAASLYQVPGEYVFGAMAIVMSLLAGTPQTTISCLLLLAVTAVLPPQDAILGFTIILATLGTSVLTRLAVRAAVLLIAVCCSLEMGFIAAACLLLDLADGKTHRRAAVCSAILTGTVLVAASALLPGFGPAACRPFTVWSWQQCDLLPHLASTFEQRQWLLVAVLTVAVCLSLQVQRQVHSARTTAIAVLFLVGLLCGHYSGAALAAITAMALRGSEERPLQPSSKAANDKRQRLPLILVTLLLGAGLYLQCGLSSRWTTSQPALNFTDMGQGKLLLGDLSHCNHWKISTAEMKLVIDDRWDVNASHYESLSGQLQDLYLGRQEIYKVSDGNWGGYRGFLQEVMPSMFVIPSRRTAAVRRVVMDPDWNVCGIDEDSVCFSHADYGSVFRAQRLLNQVRNLEWPNARSTIQLEGLIKYDTDAGAVAHSLVAMRFPNAALRLLDETGVTSPDTIAACWLEIANRTLRQTGRLPVIELAVIHQLQTQVSDEAAQEIRKVVAAWTRQAADASAGGINDDGPEESPASVIRQLISNGDFSLAKQQLDSLNDNEERSFLRILISSRVRDATNLAESLETESAQWRSDELRAEALCGAGTLYLATGHPDRALAAFLASREALNHCHTEVYRELNIRNLFGTR